MKNKAAPMQQKRGTLLRGMYDTFVVRLNLELKIKVCGSCSVATESSDVVIVSLKFWKQHMR